MNYYEILGVAKDATQAEVKKAYRKRSSESHPDREGGSDEAMAQINRASECLGDPQRRKVYDETGVDSPSSDSERTYISDAIALLMRTIEAAPDIEGDILAAVRVQIDHAIAQQIAMERVVRKRQDRLRRAAKKLKHKSATENEHGMLTHLLFDAADRMDTELEAIKGNIERMKGTRAVFDDYGWEFVAQLPGAATFYTSGATRQTGGWPNW